MRGSDVWYHIYPLGFLGAEDVNPAPGSRNGQVAPRLSGLVEWLDYVKDLGVTAVLLGPVFESESHGYDLVDPFCIDRRLGTEADLVRLIEECHRRSLIVGMDLILNHVGRRHPHFRDVIEHRQQSEWRDWFEVDFEKPGTNGFSYAMFEGHDSLVKLNHNNPHVLEWAVNLGKHWNERGVDAYRLDAAYAIPTQFLASFADQLRAARPDIFLVGEVIHGDYVRIVDQSHLNSATQYELWKAIWSSLNDLNFFELAHALQRHAAFCQHFSPWTFVGNHDTTRIATKLSNGRHLAHALALLFTLPGTPAIYAGDEQRAVGKKYDRAGGDAEVRRPPPHLPGDLPSHACSVWQLHRDLISLRRSRPWVATGVLNVSEVDNRFIKYEVQSGSQRLITLLSINDQSVPYKISDEYVQVAGSSENPLPPHGWTVWATSDIKRGGNLG